MAGWSGRNPWGRPGNSPTFSAKFHATVPVKGPDPGSRHPGYFQPLHGSGQEPLRHSAHQVRGACRQRTAEAAPARQCGPPLPAKRARLSVTFRHEERCPGTHRQRRRAPAGMRRIVRAASRAVGDSGGIRASRVAGRVWAAAPARKTGKHVATHGKRQSNFESRTKEKGKMTTNFHVRHRRRW